MFHNNSWVDKKNLQSCLTYFCIGVIRYANIMYVQSIEQKDCKESLCNKHIYNVKSVLLPSGRWCKLISKKIKDTILGNCGGYD